MLPGWHQSAARGGVVSASDGRPDATDSFTVDFATPSDGTSVWLPPEDWGLATPSPLAGVVYVDGLVKPGRKTVVAAVEGVGKSVAVDGELAIRLAVAGGSFAGTWRICQTG